MLKKVFILLFVISIHQIFTQQESQKYIFKIDYLDAKIDSSLHEDIRLNFEDYDDSIPIKSIIFDFNEDGVEEKIILNEYLCGSGGCPWIIYDVKKEIVLGDIVGKIIYVNPKIVNGYYQLESYWRLGGDRGVVQYYEFIDGQYKSVNSIELFDEQIDEYFKEKESN